MSGCQLAVALEKAERKKRRRNGVVMAERKTQPKEKDEKLAKR